MPDTVRTVEDMLSILFQDGQASGSITPQDIRDLVVSLWSGTTLNGDRPAGSFTTLAASGTLAVTGASTMTGGATLGSASGTAAVGLNIRGDGTAQRQILWQTGTTTRWRLAANTSNNWVLTGFDAAGANSRSVIDTRYASGTGADPDMVYLGPTTGTAATVGFNAAGMITGRTFQTRDATTTLSGSSANNPTPRLQITTSLSGSSTASGTAQAPNLTNVWVPSDTVAIPDSTINMMKLLWTNGGGDTGGRNGFFADMNRNNATVLADPGDALIGILSTISCAANAGGSASGYGITQFGYGGYWGALINVRMSSGATYAKGMTGIEFNVGVEAGAQIVSRNGITFITPEACTQQAVVEDMCIVQSTTPGTAGASGGAGWRHNFVLGYNGWCTSEDGYLFAAIMGVGTYNVDPIASGGFDVLHASFTGTTGKAGYGFSFRQDGGRIEPGDTYGGGIRMGHARLYSSSTGATLEASDYRVSAVSINNGGTGVVSQSFWEDQLGNLVKVTAVSGGAATAVTLVRRAWGSSTPATSTFTPIGARNAAGSGLVLNLTWTRETGLAIQPAGELGFFGATPVAKPTGVAVSAAGIHAALVSLGLIAA